jgi:protein-tyrosine phosphatase
LLDEIVSWKDEGVNVVVSLPEHHEVTELQRDQQPTFCRASDIEFVIPDRGVPASMRETEQLVRCLSAAVADGKAVAIHCRAGIGRSSVIAACILLRNGYDVNSAFDAIAVARGVGGARHRRPTSVGLGISSGGAVIAASALGRVSRTRRLSAATV